MDDGASATALITWFPTTVTFVIPVSMSPICHQLPSTSIGPQLFSA
jgi:hypothetical protein